MEAPLQGMDSEPRPILLKGWVLGCEERPFFLKASLVGCVGLSEMGFGPGVGGLKGDRALSSSAVVEMEVKASEEDSRAQVREDNGLACFLEGAMKESEALTANARAEITDEALVVEASRYESFPTIFRGNRDIFSSSPSFGFDRTLVVGDFSGSGGVDIVEEVGFQAPLCDVLTDGSS